MPSIGIDATFLKPGMVGGAEFMMKNLILGLQAANGGTDQLIVFCSKPWSLGNKSDEIFWVTSSEANRFLSGWRAIEGAKVKLDALLLPNYFTPPFLLSQKPRIVTVIHDLQYLHFPQYFSWQKRLWLRAAHEVTLRRASTVIVISNFVKDDLLKRYGDTWEKKVKVIPNPVAWERFAEPLQPEFWSILQRTIDFSSTRYILSVAAQYPHKNLETLLRAFHLLKKNKKYKDVKLILVGQLSKSLVGTVSSNAVEVLVADLQIDSEVIVTGFIADGDLGQLYKRAELFVFPSLFEGFGLPPVEALGFGLPVLTTALTSIPEATQGMATYLDNAIDYHEMADKMVSILNDPQDYRPTEQQISSIRETYSIQKIGREYYRELLKDL